MHCLILLIKQTAGIALCWHLPGAAGGAPTTFRKGCPAFTRSTAGLAACAACVPVKPYEAQRQTASLDEAR